MKKNKDKKGVGAFSDCSIFFYFHCFVLKFEIRKLTNGKKIKTGYLPIFYFLFRASKQNARRMKKIVFNSNN